MFSYYSLPKQDGSDLFIFLQSSTLLCSFDDQYTGGMLISYSDCSLLYILGCGTYQKKLVTLA